jgi:hypothetical protein
MTITAQIPTKDRDKHKIIKNDPKESDDLEGTGLKKKGNSGAATLMNSQKDDNKGASLHKAIYIPDIDKIAIVEERSDVLQFINPRTAERSCKDLDCGMTTSKMVNLFVVLLKCDL